MSDNQHEVQRNEILAAGIDQPLTDEQLQRRFGRPKIVVCGVGGAGCNAVNRMIDDGITDIKFIAINTDSQALSTSRAEVRIILGKTGLGAGGDPDQGREQAEFTSRVIESALKGANLVFVAAGMGGGTGTGASPVIARIAKSLGALTIAVVTKPFLFEGEDKSDRAIRGLAELKKAVDSYIVVSNDRLMATYRKRPTNEAFSASDHILSRAVQTIVDLIVKTGKINMDFADIKSTLTDAHLAIIGFGDAKGPNRAEEAAIAAISSPLIDASAKGCSRMLVNITHSPDVTLEELGKVVMTIRNVAQVSRPVLKFGDVRDPTLTDEIKVSAICACLTPENESKVLGQKVEEKEDDSPTPADVLPKFLADLMAGNGTVPLNSGSLGSRFISPDAIDQVKKRNAQLAGENKVLKQRAAELEGFPAKLKLAQNQINDLQAKYLESTKAKSAAQTKASESEQRWQAALEENNDLKVKLNRNQSDIAALNDTLRQSQSDLVALQAKLTEKQALISTENETVVQEAKQAQAAAESQLAASQQELAELTAQNSALRQDKSRLEAEVEKLTANLNQAQDQGQAAQAEGAEALTQLSDQLAAEKAAHQADSARLQDEIAALKRQSLAAAAQAQDLESLQAARADLQAQVTELSDKLAEALASGETQVETLRSDYEARIASLSRVNEELESSAGQDALKMQERAAKLEAESAAVAKQLRQVRGQATRESAYLATELRAAARHEKALASELATIRVEQADSARAVPALQAQISTLGQQLEDAVAQGARQRQRQYGAGVREAQDLANRLRAELHRAEHLQVELAAASAAKEAEVARFTSLDEEQGAQLEQLKGTVAQLTGQIAQQQNNQREQLAAVTAQGVRQLQGQRGASVRQAQDLANRLRAEFHRAEHLQAELAATSAAREAEAARFASLQKEADDLKASLAQKDETSANLEAEAPKRGSVQAAPAPQPIANPAAQVVEAIPAVNSVKSEESDKFAHSLLAKLGK